MYPNVYSDGVQIEMTIYNKLKWDSQTLTVEIMIIVKTPVSPPSYVTSQVSHDKIQLVLQSFVGSKHVVSLANEQ